MSSSDLPKLWTEPTKIRQIFRKQSALKIKVFKNFVNKSWSPKGRLSCHLCIECFSQLSLIGWTHFSLIFFKEKKSEKFCWFLMLKNDFKVWILQSLRRLFIVLVGLTVTWFSEKMLISHRCIHGLMSNLIKKSWTVFTGNSVCKNRDY